MRMSEGIITCKDKVESILNKYGETRDSDKLLWLAYLCTNHGLNNILGDKYPEFKKMIMNESTPTMESIRRIRQKFQEDGKYVGQKRSQRMEEKQTITEMMSRKGLK